ncbi:MAG: ATP-binding cassette domain-containing protein [Rhizobiales bacterium]|nr:ATP-binding cassette domain-containing protein [Hyphomicrobiales bacterium]
MRRAGFAMAVLAFLAGCQQRVDPSRAYGWIEADLTFMAPEESGRIVALRVAEGQRVGVGQPLFTLDDQLQKSDRDAALATLSQAQAQLARAEAPTERAEQIKVLEAALARAEAALKLSTGDLERQTNLFKSGYSSRQALDNAQAAFNRDQAGVDEARRQIQAAGVGGREEDIRAAREQVAIAEARLAAAREREARRTVIASENGVVQATYFRAGEMATAGKPGERGAEAALLRLRGVAGAVRARRNRGGVLRRLLQPCARPRDLHRQRGGIYAAGDLQPRGALEARLHDRGAAGKDRGPAPRPADHRHCSRAAMTARAAMTNERNGGAPARGAGDGEPVISVHGLTKKFNGKTVVDNIDLTVRKGAIHGFLGPNGSGKTTTIRMLCGLLTPDAGEGTCLGFNIRTEAQKIKRRVGYMTQKFSLYGDLTVRENLDFVASLYELPDARAAVDATLKQLGLDTRGGQLAATLSGGWKQRLALGACMLPKPALLLLDEPTAGVDPQARRDFWAEIHRLSSEGVTILVSTHYMDEAERCHEIAFIAYGRLLAGGSVEQLIDQSGLVTWEVSGDGALEVGAELEGKPGVDIVAPFGLSYHIGGRDRAKLETAIAPYRNRPGLAWKQSVPTLEDIFINLMRSAEDNQ